MKEIHISSGIIIDKNMRILLIKRGLLVKSNKNYWAVPSGKCEQGESFESAAIREVKEEIGVDFFVKELYIEDTIGIPEKGNIKIGHRYLGDVEGRISLQEEECDGYAWFTYEETKNLLLTSNMKNLLQKLHIDGYIL